MNKKSSLIICPTCGGKGEIKTITKKVDRMTRAVHDLREEGMTYSQIMNQLGISTPSMVNYYVRRYESHNQDDRQEEPARRDGGDRIARE